MSDFEFVPTAQQLEESNLYQFMKKHNLNSIEELSKKANENLEWFWEEVDKDVGIVWDSPYSKTLDSSKGIAWSKWFIDGKTNIYKSSVGKICKLCS